MAPLLQSFVKGQWVTADDAGVALANAVTGADVARYSTQGLDFSAAVNYARDVGGPALSALTFPQRAGCLKQLGKLLMAGKDEFYPLSFATGATARDSAIDIDGGIGTLLSYAGKGARELPNDTIYLDGSTETIGRAGTFVGQHIYTTRPGVAVQINAFNFPVWGMLEKLAPALLAGVPTIVKPAHQTAYLTEHLVRRVIASGLLPEGSLQLVCASPGGLLDELGEHDQVAFTGSAATATRLRCELSALGRGVRFNAEADSLNCSILGP
ncbi:aldehyde dehydrogenase family protein, partial [Mycobacterium sp.]|uniref:aldehyde dehydrogenase family protein n=1 Tax=Mycobacterium sp. TaxID=1785 RepID=UPI002D03B2F1